MQTIKKLNLSAELRSSVVRYIAAFICVIAVGAVLIAAQGVNPAQAFATIIKGAFGSKLGFGSTLRNAMPCIMLGIAAAVAFKTGVWNLGIQGQMYVGSLVAAVVGYMIVLPKGIHALFCILAGGIAGALWGLLPALAKMLFNVSETVMSIMLNYIALFLCEYLVQWVILEGKNLGTVALETQTILPSASLPVHMKGTTASTGIFIALAIAVATHILFKHTVLGYELKQVGENIRYSKVGGVNVSKIFLLIFILSSFIAGVAGSVEIIGPVRRFSANYAANMPWEGIMISFICKHEPLAIIAVSFIWGALRAGALSMERTMGIDRMTILIVQMLFVVFVSVDFEMIWRTLKGKAVALKK